MPLKQETNDNDNITNEAKYEVMNDDNINKLLIDNINIYFSSSKQDKIKRNNKDNDDDFPTLLSLNNVSRLHLRYIFLKATASVQVIIAVFSKKINW